MRIVRHLEDIKRSDHGSFGSSGDGGSYGGGGGGSYGGGDYSGGHGSGGFEASAGPLESGGGHLDGGHQDYSSFGGYGGHGGDDGGHGISLDGGHNFVHSVPISEHVEVTKPIAVPVVKEIGKYGIKTEQKDQKKKKKERKQGTVISTKNKNHVCAFISSQVYRCHNQ